MAVARQSAMLAPASLPPAMSPLVWPKPTPSARLEFRRLNARHRQHLIVKDLMQGLAVDTPPPVAGVLTATLTCGATVPSVALALDKSDADLWKDQIAQVVAQKWHRPERMEEIVLQQSDILSFLTLGLPVAADTHPWLTTLLDAVFEMALRVVAEMKHFFAMPRPYEISPDVAPVIRTPSHGAFPSGHATEAFAAAAVLSALWPDQSAHLRQMAARIAMNRCYAGVHYPVDQYAGAMLGDVLGGMAVQRVLGLSPFKAPATALAFPSPAPTITPNMTVERYALDSPVLKKPVPPAGLASSEVLAVLADLIRDEK